MVKSEVELLAREAVAVLLNVGPGYDWHLFAGDRPSWNKYVRRTHNENRRPKAVLFKLKSF